MHDRSFYSLVGIAVITLLALLIAVSGTGLFTLHLGRPVTVQLGLDLQGGARILLQAMPTSGQALDDETMEATRRIIESRVNGGLGVTEPVIQTVTSGDKRFISVELPGLKKNLQNVESVLQKTGQLTLVALDATPLPPGASTHSYRVLARGTDIDGKKVAVGTDAVGAPAVDVTVRGPAAARIAEYTAAHVGGYMGIALDNRIYDSPQIQSPLGNQFQITNVGSLDNAKNLAITLKYGALPVPLQVTGVQEVSATLGPDNVRASILAGAVGLVIVMLFMAVHYSVPGLLADAALLIYALVVFALFKLIPVTLTLAGIAGFILSIGMAVDANILIFERMKEELRAGRRIRAAMDAGFSRAWPSIRDSNFSTLITCAILFWFGNQFGASIVKGFALTLAIGVVVSMFTAIFVTRTFLRALQSLGLTTVGGWAGLVPSP